MKQCFKCDAVLPLSGFYKHPKMADGYLNKCKECAKRDVSKNYRDNFDHYQAYEKDRALRPERVEYSMERMRKWRTENPEKYAAHTKLNNSVRDGKVERLPCEVCGCSEVHAHHDDYSRPLDVKWLCAKHHHSVHRQDL